jgi:hypothetical protein
MDSEFPEPQAVCRQPLTDENTFRAVIIASYSSVISLLSRPLCVSYNRDMDIRTRSRKRSRIFGIALLAASVLFAAYCLWPTAYRSESFSVVSPLLPQEYQLEVRYPRFGPAGDTAGVDAYWRPKGQAVNFNTPGQSNPVLVAEIQSADIAFSPNGQISTPLQEGKEAHFSWEASSTAAGDGTFNLFFFKAGAEQTEGIYVQQPVWARSFPYSSFAGPGGLKIPLLFFAVFGAIFGLGFLLRDSLR